MDKRVIKTKHNLKQALRDLLQEKAFDKITVTEICSTANTSRITFYTHYDDKYNLLEDLFKDREQEMKVSFEKLQLQNNRSDDPLKSYQNLLEVFINTFYGNFNFFHSSPIENNMDLMFLYYNFMTSHIASFEEKYKDQMVSRFPGKQMSAFWALGIFGFIHQADEMNYPIEEIKADAKILIGNIVNSEIYEKN